MFYLLNFKRHTFVGFHTANEAIGHAANLMRFDLTRKEDLEIVNAIDDERYTFDDFVDRFRYEGDDSDAED